MFPYRKRYLKKIKELPNFYQIIFDHVTISKENFPKFLKAIKSKKRLEILSVMKCGIDKDNMKELLKLIELKNIPNLKFLNISKNEFNPISDSALLTNAIFQLPLLVSIAVNNWNIGNDGMLMLLGKLKQFKFLKEIYIANNNLNDQLLESLAKDMRKDFKSITHLNLCGNNITEKGDILLGKILDNKNDLQYIRIGTNKIKPAGLKSFLRSLDGKGKVTDIDIDENSLGDEGANILYGFLEQNKLLEYLNIMKNDISEKNALNILYLLKKQTIACKINVYGNKIKDETISKYFSASEPLNSANNQNACPNK